MKALKKEKMEEILRKIAADFVLREATPASLITVTRVELAPSGKAANLFFTTLPEKEEDTALKFLMRKGGELHGFVREKSRIGIVPQLTWRIDYGERNRQRLDEISKDL
ncbi:MAG: Ribosome-binding factor [Parcubacteria group bacterium]|nr:Ribosome-binding factor [Parcubacteria group bacterium]